LCVAPLVLCLQACGGPVTASDCSAHEGPHGTVSLRATLSNHTPRTMTHVGVLVSATGSTVEYEFNDTLRPFETRSALVGSEYAAHDNPAGGTLSDHLSPISSCWARIVMYADGTSWSVSPL
jgi:hypothetical protein